MDFKEIYEIRRTRNSLKKLDSMLQRHTGNGVANAGIISLTLETAARKLLMDKVQAATPDEIIANAHSIANMARYQRK